MVHAVCLKSWETYNPAGTSVTLAQNVGRFFQERIGSRSGLNKRTVTFPRPRAEVTTNGIPPDDTTTFPERTTPVVTGNSAVSKSKSSGKSVNGRIPPGPPDFNHSCNSGCRETFFIPFRSNGTSSFNHGVALTSDTCSTPTIKCPPAFSHPYRAFIWASFNSRDFSELK